MTIIINWNEYRQETIENVIGIAADREKDSLVIWYTKYGQVIYLTLQFAEYVKIIIL